MHVGEGAEHAVVVCCFPETPLLSPPCSGDQIVGATIYFDNLQSGEVTQLLSTMGHHAVGLKLHRKGDRSPEPGQTWTHGVFSSHGSEVVLVSASPAHPSPEVPPATAACWPRFLSLLSAHWTALVILSPNFTPSVSLLSQSVCSYSLGACGRRCPQVPPAVSSECRSVGTNSCRLVLDVGRKVGCSARVFEMISRVPSSASQRPGLTCESEAEQQSA